jgi:hypothetical protein
MKYAKTFGLLVVAACLAMASVGLSPAAAKGKVCSTAGKGTACGGTHGSEYTGPFKATLIATTGSAEKHVVLTSGFVQWTCAESGLEGEVTAPSTATAFITKLTFGGCTNNINGGPCTMVSSASSTNKWHATGTADAGTTGSGTMDVSGVTSSYTCNIFFANRTCTYKAASATVDVFSSDTAPTIEVTGVALEREEPSDGLCSPTATWEGRYQITTPTSLWIT